MLSELLEIGNTAFAYCESLEDINLPTSIEKVGLDIFEGTKYLKKLILDKNLRTSLGENGRKRVLENYDWNSNVEYMIKIYEEIING